MNTGERITLLGERDGAPEVFVAVWPGQSRDKVLDSGEALSGVQGYSPFALPSGAIADGD